MRDFIITAGICIYMVTMLVIQQEALSSTIERKALEHDEREKRVELRLEMKRTEEEGDAGEKDNGKGGRNTDTAAAFTCGIPHEAAVII